MCFRSCLGGCAYGACEDEALASQTRRNSMFELMEPICRAHLEPADGHVRQTLIIDAASNVAADPSEGIMCLARVIRLRHRRSVSSVDPIFRSIRIFQCITEAMCLSAGVPEASPHAPICASQCDRRRMFLTRCSGAAILRFAGALS